MGGLGNQLFQIAAAYAYSKKHDKDLYLDTSHWDGGQGRSPNDYAETIFRNFKFENSKPDTTTIREERELCFAELPFAEGDVKLEGYFQSPGYFLWCFEHFKNELCLSEFLNHLPVPSEKTVAFHIRRGDYLNYSHIYNICGTDYFNRMFDMFSDYVVNVFTDSPEHVCREFGNRSFNLIQSEFELKVFSYMCLHRNIVCSNSSFSWWASQLGTKKERVVVPNKWLLTSDSKELYLDNMTLAEC